MLKSPHVNKIAQEQFECKIYRKKIICFTNQPFIFLKVFKYLRVRHLSDIFVSIKLTTDPCKSKKKIKRTINFDFFYFEKFNFNSILNKLKFLELYGEFLTKSV